MAAPDPVWADDDLRVAGIAASDSARAALDLLCLARDQATADSSSVAADTLLAASAQQLVNRTQKARDSIRPLASEFMRLRSTIDDPVPAWCGQSDAFALGSAFRFANSVMDRCLVGVKDKPGARRLIVPNHESTLSDCARATLSVARKQLAEFANQWAMPSYDEIQAAIDDEIGMIMLARAQSGPRDPDTVRRFGEQYLAELYGRSNVDEEVHPDEAALREWLTDGRVGRKFNGPWHQLIAEAQRWRIPVAPTWHVIASCLDSLFPKTSNTFNPYDNRLPVQEPELFAYLAKKHSLSKEQAGSLSLNDLAQKLQSDQQRSSSVRKKRSSESGGARAKLIAALTKHHKYAEGGCLNLEPIGNNELARLADVAKRTASAFFNKDFDGYSRYRSLCHDTARLTASLKALNGEFRPRDFLNVRAPDELEADAE